LKLSLTCLHRNKPELKNIVYLISANDVDYFILIKANVLGIEHSMPGTLASPEYTSPCSINIRLLRRIRRCQIDGQPQVDDQRMFWWVPKTGYDMQIEFAVSVALFCIMDELNELVCCLNLFDSTVVFSLSWICWPVSRIRCVTVFIISSTTARD
jgi:hypothetical protein